MTDILSHTDLFIPLLDALRDLGGSARPREVNDWIAERLRLSEDQLALENRDGVNRFYNRVAWARFYLAKAGYLDSSRRGVWTLTDRGRATESLTAADIQEIKRAARPDESTDDAERQDSSEAPGRTLPLEDEEDPNEQGVRDKLKAILRSMSAAGFERFCQRLLREAGFESVEVTGRSGDGGIDGHGILRVNPLVSFRVIFQSKRYTGAVGSPQVRDFRGAMTGRADRGLLITTSTFSREAEREAARDGAAPIELVDADSIIDLLEALELGLTPISTYSVDEDFFEEFLV